MREEPDVSSWHQVALAAALFFAGLPQASRRSLDLLGGKGKSPGAARMTRLFQWTLPVWNAARLERSPGSAGSVSSCGPARRQRLRLEWDGAPEHVINARA